MTSGSPSALRRLGRRLVPFPIRVELVRLRRLPSMWLEHSEMARRSSHAPFPVVLFEHSSPIERPGMEGSRLLRSGKRANIEAVSSRINGALIEPGQVFSYHHLVGRPSLLRGFRLGLELHRERESAGVGGGACKVSNLLYWMALNTGMEIVERHRHSLDLFPDKNRRVPFGCGATVFYTMADFRFRNPHPTPVRIDLFIDREDHLVGRIRSTKRLAHTYIVEEVDHRFVLEGETWWRENRILRHAVDASGEVLQSECVAQNRARTCYTPQSLLEE